MLTSIEAIRASVWVHGCGQRCFVKQESEMTEEALSRGD